MGGIRKDSLWAFRGYGSRNVTKRLEDRLHRTAGRDSSDGQPRGRANQLREAVWTFEMQEDFCWPVVIMDGDVERSLSGDLALLCDVIAAVGKSNA
jgi:transposase-like protein